MLKKLIFIFLMAITVSAFSQEEQNIGISHDWEQLSKKDQALLKKSSERYIKKLANKDLEGFWGLCHSKFKDFTPHDAFMKIGEKVAELIPSFDSVKFIDAKTVDYTLAPTSSLFATGGTIDKNNPDYIQFYTFAGIKNQAISFYKINRDSLSKVITMKFGLEDREYKLIGIEINNCSLNGKDANYYKILANKWKDNELKFPQFMALVMAYRLSYLGSGISTSSMLELMHTIKEFQSDKAFNTEIRTWNIQDSIYTIIDFDFLEAKDDIAPNIMYLSKEKLGEQTTTKEVEILFTYFKEKYPEVCKEFNKIVFTAYEEYPTSQTKVYTYFRVIKDVNKSK